MSLCARFQVSVSSGYDLTPFNVTDRHLDGFRTEYMNSYRWDGGDVWYNGILKYLLVTTYTNFVSKFQSSAACSSTNSSCSFSMTITLQSSAAISFSQFQCNIRIQITRKTY